MHGAQHMKLSDRYYYTILCEDKQMQGFMIQFLRHQNINRHHIRVVSGPGGLGSGEEFVRKQLSAELRELQRKNYRRIALIVFTDADNCTVEERTGFLQREVPEQTLSKTKDLLIWIPKRHVETWIAFLRGDSDVNEEKNYRHSTPERCKTESVKMSMLFQEEKCEGITLPSMKTAKEFYDLFCRQQRT